MHNLSKSNRLKERREEDARLDQMSADSDPEVMITGNGSRPNSSSPSSTPKVTESEPRPDCYSAGSTGTPEVTEYEPRPDCLWKFHPVDEVWQKRVCGALGLKYCGQNGVARGGPEVCLTNPVSVKRIRGDGNCFYRSIVYIITGSQEEHPAMRKAIVNHMRATGDQLIMRQGVGVEQYIAESSVENNGEWATETEMYAACHLLRTVIYSYIQAQGVWRCMHPRLMDNTLAERDISKMGIYIDNPPNHFEVVQSVAPCNHCSSRNERTPQTEPVAVDSSPLSLGIAALPTTETSALPILPAVVEPPSAALPFSSLPTIL